MARPVTTLVVFFLAFNLFAGMMSATGVDAMLGIDSTVGETEQAEELEGETGEVSTGSSLGNTLFGMYNALVSRLGGIFNFIFPGLAMLNRAGVPSYITTGFLSPLFSLFITLGVVSFLRGWDL